MMSDFNIYYQNVRGLRTKTDVFLQNVLSRDLDVIVLCETWLIDGIHSSELFDKRYTVYRADRDRNLINKKDGGGCLIAIKSCLYSSRIEEWEVRSEDMWISVYRNEFEKFFINVKYIDCNATIEQYKLHLDKIDEITNVVMPSGQFLLLGDYNLSDSVTWTASPDGICMPQNVAGTKKVFANAVIDTLSTANLCQFNQVRNNSDRTLDLVLSNLNHDKLKVFEDIDPLVKIDLHHPALLVTVNMKPLEYLEEDRLPKFNFFRADYEELNKLIESIDWVRELQSLTTDESTERFYELLRTLIVHVPKVRSATSGFPCWYTHKLIKLVKSKFVAHQMYKDEKAKGHDTTIAYATFSRLRKAVKQLMFQCHENYVQNIEEKLPSNTKCFFAYTKSLKSSNSLPNVIHHDGVSARDRRAACSMFAEYFASVYQQPDSERIPITEPAKKFLMPTVTSTVVKSVLDRLDQYKVSSPDNFPSIFFKKLSRSISSPLAIIYNKSLEEGHFPTRWKVSFVTPTFKSGNRSKVENYRPISILCAMSKVFERIVFNQLYIHIKPHISPSQHGFVPGRSTQTNLLEYVTFVVESISKGGQVDTIFTDFSKAFDQVSHNLVLQDLQNLGVCDAILRWFRSYLIHRRQFVMIGSTKSDAITPTSGIPQGSILGPLLFLIFINKLPKVFASSFSSLFADDHKLAKRIDSTSDCIALQNDLNLLSDWCRSRRLNLNTEKCFDLTTTYKPQPIKRVYKIDDRATTNVTVKKDLGVNFDGKVKFKDHFRTATRKCYQMIGFIFRATKLFKDPNSILKLYYSYVRSRLEYCCSVWNPYYTKYIDMIERVQKKFTRMLYFRFNWEKPNYKTRLKQLHMVSLETRRLQSDEILLHKIIHGYVNTSINSLIRFNLPHRVTRNPPTFYLPTTSTNYAANAPIHRMLDNHNKIFSSIDIRNPNRLTFKNAIKTFFEY